MQASTTSIQPTRAAAPDLRTQLDAATARTASAIADPAATAADRYAAAEAEMEAFDSYWHTGPDAQAELEAGL